MFPCHPIPLPLITSKYGGTSRTSAHIVSLTPSSLSCSNCGLFKWQRDGMLRVSPHYLLEYMPCLVISHLFIIKGDRLYHRV